jgi:hypothetical protein
MGICKIVRCSCPCRFIHSMYLVCPWFLYQHRQLSQRWLTCYNQIYQLHCSDSDISLLLHFGSTTPCVDSISLFVKQEVENTHRDRSWLLGNKTANCFSWQDWKQQYKMPLKPSQPLHRLTTSDKKVSQTASPSTRYYNHDTTNVQTRALDIQPNRRLQLRDGKW